MILHIIVLDGGIGIIEILNKSNIIALVGGGSKPKFPKNKVIIWDDLQSKVISEVKFTSDVLAIRINTFHLFVICKNKSDAIKFYNILLKKYEKIKRVVFTGKITTRSDIGNTIINLIQEKTGWDRRKIIKMNTQ